MKLIIFEKKIQNAKLSTSKIIFNKVTRGYLMSRENK